MELASSLDIRVGNREYEGYRTHWAVKNIDLLELLQERKIVDRKQISPHAPYAPNKAAREAIQVRPQIFEIPPKPVDRRLVAVMMPFAAAFVGVYEAISQSAQKAGLYTQKADDIWDHTVLIQDIFGLIIDRTSLSATSVARIRMCSTKLGSPICSAAMSYPLRNPTTMFPLIYVLTGTYPI
ncbi:hypothetical protein N2601_31155 (plasmid) [Rhizobium sp. CB3060]|uniref:hypothetical protein n=1 Tax=Rhizobium sp. CB3060 TaxID=3138255 RepID=UPI0021A688B8|nr:hypothetical protein [Rhizobium tropici]UWU25448.1 hypothetical protein N2601_31155 [Rhizobium tropici]